MNYTLKWNSLNDRQWEESFLKIPCSNLLQSSSYAHAMAHLQGLKSYRAEIEIEGKPAGLLQVLETGLLKNALHAIILDRGPLWFDGYGSAEHNHMFFETFAKKYPRRFGRRRRIIPELESTPDNKNMLQNLGFKHRDNSVYETIWLDLRPDEETLRANLKGKWRNILRRAERANLTIEWDQTGMNFPWVMKHYALDKAVRGYDGPSLKLMNALAQSFVRNQNMLIGRAILENEAIATILVLCHGASATYQIGWTSEQGRKTASHHLLLWDLLRVLKGLEVYDLDLGGINHETAPGVKTFKQGMGGKIIRLAGLYS